MDGAIVLYELLATPGPHENVLVSLNLILEAVPNAFDYIIKAAKKSSTIHRRAPLSDLVEQFKTGDETLKFQVVQFINNLLKHAPNDKSVCKLIAYLEGLNFYEYLQSASNIVETASKEAADLHSQIVEFQKLSNVVIHTTKYENTALKSRIKELTEENDLLKDKDSQYIQQQNLYELMKDDFKSLNSLASMSIEKATLFTPCIFDSLILF